MIDGGLSGHGARNQGVRMRTAAIVVLGLALSGCVASGGPRTVQQQAQADAASDAMMAAGLAMMSPRSAPLVDMGPSAFQAPVTCNSQRLGGYVQTNCY